MYLKSEPNLARVALILVVLILFGLWMYMATHPDVSD